MKQIVIPRSEFFQKGFVRSHTRNGKQVAGFYTKRKPGKVDEKHAKARFYDHDKSSAKKAHEDLETRKSKHKVTIDALKNELSRIKKEGPKDEENISHIDKLSHLNQQIKNEDQHIDNHSKKQDHIRNRYKIAGEQHERKRVKSDLEKKIAPHSEEQKETIRKIHGEHQKTGTHETGRVLTGKDKDHVYLERKNKETGEIHHVAIHKDGTIKDPNILHSGKFDSKTLTDKQAEIEKKKVVVKRPVKKQKPKVEPELRKEEKVEKPIKENTKESKKVIVKKEVPKSGKTKKESAVFLKKVNTKKYGEITRKEHVEKLIEYGGGVEIFKTKDSTKANKASNEYSNWLSGDKVDKDKGKKLKKEHEKWHEKDEYRLTEGEDIYYKVSKAEYDYASKLLETKKELKKSITTSPQLKNLEEKEELVKSLSKQKSIKEKHKRRKKRKKSRK